MRGRKKITADPVDSSVVAKKGSSLSQVRKPPAKRSRGGGRQSGKNPKDEAGGSLVPEDQCPLPSMEEKVSNPLTVFGQNPGTNEPSRKIKLQLFPIDKNTLMGLEKEGYHPYLELTLSRRKKISSVLQHLNAKWGKSSIASGQQPMVFPYNTMDKSSSCRWTSRNTDVCTEDVYAAVGRPSVFRLRYGWFYDSKAESQSLGSASNQNDACLQLAETGKCSSTVETIDVKGKQIIEETKLAVSRGATVSVSALTEPLATTMRADIGVGQPVVPWDDCISIGGLLSEASLQGKSSKSSEQQTNGSSSLFFTESFDAFISGQPSSSICPRFVPPASTSSILNAEDTCHAFTFQTFASGRSSKEEVSKLVNSQPGIPEGQEGTTGALNDESSLGLSGIKWTESLGPFDLGLSSSRKIIHNDSIISIGSIFS
ncbi:unnamed protein product [Linum trigynum]|uniref:TSL-kinase interacting protein 1 n=1 Tax=Linum trigynum TaxID=586398 RepID=A0AAV2GED4_9ROSI